MAEVKGKFIKMVGNLMLPTESAEANEYLKKRTGLIHRELDNEGWYDTDIFNEFMKTCSSKSATKDYIYIVVGKKVYPTIQKSVGLPPHLKTPLDFILFELEGFMMNHRGDDVSPRRIIKAKDRDVEVEAKAPGYNSKLFEGVWLGILEMCGVSSGKVENLGNDMFRITW